MAEKALTIQAGQAGDVELDGALYTPEGAPPARVVVVCHPHPQYGGDRFNSVVMAVAVRLVEAGIGALTFNFRSAGSGAGGFGAPGGEEEDVRATLTQARSLPGVGRVGLAGYSFGARMAASVADDSIPALALVSLPSRGPSPEPTALRSYPNPVLLVSGDSDPVSPGDAIRGLASALPHAEAIIVPGADHFWWGYEQPLAEAIRQFFERHL